MNLFNFNLFSGRPKAFGLDIEDDSLKAFRLEKSGRGFEVAAFGRRNIKKGILNFGRVADAEELAREIKGLLISTKPKAINTKYVVFSVPETKSFIRTIKIPKMSCAEAIEAVKWETETNIPISVDKVYLDWQVIGSEKGQDEILVAAVPKNIVDGYCKAVMLAGLAPLVVEIDLIAAIRSLTTEKDNRAPALIADIGERRTGLTICKNQIPYFSSSIPLSGKAFTEAIQKELGISEEKAEKMKIKYGLGKMKESDTLYKIYNPLIEGLVSGIDKSITFYNESINKKEKVNKIILSGGGSLLKEMRSYLSLRVKKEVVFGNPLKNIAPGGNLPPALEKETAFYATAIGLALRGADYESYYQCSA